jgi:hypothetical protein
MVLPYLHPYVIHTRMEATRAGQVSKLESVVTDQGDWMFGAAEHLAVTRRQDWGEIPRARRDTRAVLKAAADAYLDNWGNPELPVPHGTPCSRLEGRIDTGARDPAANTCDMGAFPQKLKVGHRRYVIDESLGAVSVFHDFPWLDAGLPVDPGTPASQMFRIEGGKTRYIHEATVCTTPGWRSRSGSSSPRRSSGSRRPERSRPRAKLPDVAPAPEPDRRARCCSGTRKVQIGMAPMRHLGHRAWDRKRTLKLGQR